MPEEMRAEFQVLVSAGVGAATPEERAEIYRQATQLDYERVPAIRLAVPTNRFYEPRWMSGYYFNPIYGPFNHYITAGKE
jgi:peptide/nickel transport system substrate-binding protein